MDGEVQERVEELLDYLDEAFGIEEHELPHISACLDNLFAERDGL